MSGSSLDGLDICYVRFQRQGANFNYEILHADCIAYSDDFKQQLRNAPALTAIQFAQLHSSVGKYFGQLTATFIQQHSITQLDFICSHGQTIFHQPNLGFTTQIGCGAHIAAQTGSKVICDLRTSDVAYGGQGAPIVPVAEHFLFPDHKIFLNIGGIANIAFHSSESRSVVAFDVCAANTILNYLANQKNLSYDKNGEIARNGTVIASLLDELNHIVFCQQPAPKSLGSEHIYADWIPLLDRYDHCIEDKLATAVEHIAMQVGNQMTSEITNMTSEMLITGGGALNTFLVERIQQHTSLKVVVPDLLTVQYKEALAMAFIGLLRMVEIPNCLSSVSGASKDVIGGAVYLP